MKNVKHGSMAIAMILGISGCALNPDNESSGHRNLISQTQASIDAAIKDGTTTLAQVNAFVGQSYMPDGSIPSQVICPAAGAAGMCYYYGTMIDYGQGAVVGNGLTVNYNAAGIVTSHNVIPVRTEF